MAQGQTLALNPVGVEVDVVTFGRWFGDGTPQIAGARRRALPRGSAPELYARQGRRGAALKLVVLCPA